DQALGVQGVRNCVHARARDRDVHGLPGGRVRRLLQLRALRAQARGGRVVSERALSERAKGRASGEDREQRILEIIETARSKRPRFKDTQITMSHGAGGKATQTMIEGLFVPAF